MTSSAPYLDNPSAPLPKKDTFGLLEDLIKKQKSAATEDMSPFRTSMSLMPGRGLKKKQDEPNETLEPEVNVEIEKLNPKPKEAEMVVEKEKTEVALQEKEKEKEKESEKPARKPRVRRAAPASKEFCEEEGTNLYETFPNAALAQYLSHFVPDDEVLEKILEKKGKRGRGKSSRFIIQKEVYPLMRKLLRDCSVRMLHAGVTEASHCQSDTVSAFHIINGMRHTSSPTVTVSGEGISNIPIWRFSDLKISDADMDELD